MAEIEAGNLYNMNKMLVQKAQKKLNHMALLKKTTDVIIPFFEKYSLKKYFMLLCHQQRDYTLFDFKSVHPMNTDFNSFAASELRDCLLNRGDVYSIDWDGEEKNALELWIKNEQGMFCYYLFPYDNGVIEIG